MSLPEKYELTSEYAYLNPLPGIEIPEAIIETERKLFDLRFKKATRQNFKSHEIKRTKRQLAHLRSLLTRRFLECRGDRYEHYCNIVNGFYKSETGEYITIKKIKYP